MKHINQNHTAIVTVQLDEDTEFQLLGDLMELTDEGVNISHAAIINSQTKAWDLYQDAVAKEMTSYYYMDHIQRLAVLRECLYGNPDDFSH